MYFIAIFAFNLIEGALTYRVHGLENRDNEIQSEPFQTLSGW